VTLIATKEEISTLEAKRETQNVDLRGDCDAREIAVRVRALVKRYKDGTEANRGIDLTVRRGEVVSILGPNGAGKTTFLRQITTELRPTSGSIEIFGVDSIAHPHAAKRWMGITPQDAGLFDSLSVREHFELFARLKGVEKDAAARAAVETIDELELSEQARKRVGKLSGGQRRRVLIGLALLGRPPLLVLDEPTTGLDPASRQTVWQVIRRAVARGTTVVLSTHYMEEAERLSDKIGIIAAGRLIAFGSLAEMRAKIDKSYCVTFRDEFDHFGALESRCFATFREAQNFIARERLAEYSIHRATLEDVYFVLTGEHLNDEEKSAVEVLQ
jgi:ABC-2 type transport system ATP-binding protein